MKKMKSETPDDLDRLLASSPMRKAPAWFEAKTLARLRQEQSSRPVWALVFENLHGARRWVLGSAAAACLILAGLGAVWFLPSGLNPGHDRMASDKKMFEAFAAFNSYATEQESWSGEGY